MVHDALDRVVAHIASLPDQPAAYAGGGEALARELAQSLPETGTPFETLLALLFERAIPLSFNTASPGYLAYVPGGGVFHSAVADFIADAVNRYVGVWVAAPGLARIESNVVRWFCDIVGYPPEAGGLLTTGGSMANLVAVITARRARLGEQFQEAVLYVPDQMHHSFGKAAILAGFPAAHVRAVPADATFRVRVDRLAAMIAEDRARGRTPFLAAASAGTTNSGAVDDLNAVADLAEREGLWFHVDAAYGGFFALTERGRRILDGLARADSMILDPHKGLFLPYGNGSLLVRDAAVLRRAHATSADYMPEMQEDPDLVDFCQLSPELSRDFRGLRAWLPIMMHGIGVFRRNLDEKLDLARWAAGRLCEIEDMEILAEPQLSIVAFRLAPAGWSEEDLDRLNHRLLEQINARERVYLTATRLNGRFAIRICVLSFRTHQDRMEAGLEDIRAAAAEVLARGGTGAIG